MAVLDFCQISVTPLPLLLHFSLFLLELPNLKGRPTWRPSLCFRSCSRLPQKLWQLGDIRRDPPSLIFGELGR
jgi:hypothetical protein